MAIPMEVARIGKNALNLTKAAPRRTLFRVDTRLEHLTQRATVMRLVAMFLTVAVLLIVAMECQAGTSVHRSRSVFHTETHLSDPTVTEVQLGPVVSVQSLPSVYASSSRTVRVNHRVSVKHSRSRRSFKTSGCN